MAKSKKRTFAVLASLITLILSLALIVVNGLAVAEIFVKKQNKSLLKSLKMKPMTQLKNAISTLDPKTMELAIMGVLVLAGLILLILSFKNFKKINKKGQVNYSGKRMFVMFLIVAVVAGLAFLAFTAKKDPLKGIMKDKETGIVKLIVLAYLALAGVSALLIIISALCKKNKSSKANRVFGVAPVANYACEPIAQPMAVKYNANDLSPSIYFIQEKIAKLNQLRAMGIITESQYNEAVTRFTNCI